MIEEELYTHLKNNVALVNERIYPLVMPQKSVKPALVYSVISDSDIETLGCVVGNNIRFQIDIYGQSYSNVKMIKEELKTALYSFVYKPQNLSVTEGYEEDTKLHRQTFDFKFKI